MGGYSVQNLVGGRALGYLHSTPLKTFQKKNKKIFFINPFLTYKSYNFRTTIFYLHKQRTLLKIKMNPLLWHFKQYYYYVKSF
jgi:hypothetical protein